MNATDRNSLATLDAPDEHLADLAARLADRAERAGELDVAYRTLDSPIGELILAATKRGLVRVAFGWSEPGALDELAQSVSPRILRAPGRLDSVARQLDEYFRGRRRRFDLTVDWRLVRGFRLDVLRHLSLVDYGATVSYADLADAAGSPRAVRAVGTACGHNPLPVVVPCHRVIRSDGTIGNYGGGVETKRALLSLEGVEFR